MAKAKAITLDIPGPGFEGFSEETVRFLHHLKKNNNKEWFEDHRSDYEQYLRNPSKALVEEMGVKLRENKLPFIANPKTSLFRINRDIRFSADKSPYKTHVGLWFPLEGTAKGFWCGVYFGFEPEGKNEIKAFVGGGVHMPEAPQLKSMRAKIAKEFKRFKQLNEDKAFREAFPKGVEGASLKRMPKGYEEGHPAEHFLKLKEYVFSSPCNKETLLQEDLADFLLHKFEQAKKMTEFLGAL